MEYDWQQETYASDRRPPWVCEVLHEARSVEKVATKIRINKVLLAGEARISVESGERCKSDSSLYNGVQVHCQKKCHERNRSQP